MTCAGLVTAFVLLQSMPAISMGIAQHAKQSDSVGCVTKSQIVVTGQAYSLPRDQSIHRIRVMDSTRIVAQQAVSLRDVLITELNVGIQHDAVLGGSTSIQGIGGNGVKVLVDGVPVVGKLNGNTDINQILLANADHVEVVEGPMAVMYGSDAIGGVINVISKDHMADGVHASAHCYAESVGTYNTTLGVAGNLGPLLLSTQVARNVFDGWSDRDFKRFAQWKPREQYLADFRIQPTWEHFRAHYDVHIFSETILNRGEPRAPYGETAFDDEYKTVRLMNSAVAHWQATPTLNMQGTAAYTMYRREKHSSIKDLVTLQTQPTAGQGDQDTTLINTFMTRLIAAIGRDTSRTSASVGTELTHESMSSGRLLSAATTMSDAALFTELRWKPSSAFTVQLGGRAMWNSTFGPYGVPSLHAIIKPSANATLRASVAQGFRAPGLREMYLYFVDINHDIIGNPLLLPEQSTAVNLSGSFLWSDATSVVRVEPSAYFNDVRRMISLSQLQGMQQYTYVNIGRMVTCGIQAEAIYTNELIEVSVGGTLAAISSNADAATLAPLVWSPQLKSTIRYTLPWPDAVLNAFLKYTGTSVQQVQTSTSTTVTQRSDPFTMLDITIGQRFLSNSITVSVGCKNVFDVTTIAISTQAGVHGNGGSRLLGMGRMFTADLSLRIP